MNKIREGRTMGNQGMREVKFQQKTREHAKVLRPVEGKVNVSRERAV